jgi:cytochrome P450
MSTTVGGLPGVDLLDHDLFADHEPWEVFERLQREAPVYFHPEPGGRGFWALTKYEDVQAVLRDPKTFSSEVGGAAMIEDLPEDVLEVRRNFLEFDPPKHGRYRRLISKNFTPGAVGAYEEWLRGLVRERLDRRSPWASSTSSTSSPPPSRSGSSRRSSGCPTRCCPAREARRPAARRHGPEYVGEHAYAGELDEHRYKPFGSPWADELCALGRAYYADRRACPRDDVLTKIAVGEVDGARSRPGELDNMFALMIVAGNETTRQALSLGTLALCEQPEQYDRLRADRSLIPSAVDELLRHRAPVWFFRRTTTRDVTVRGVDIPAGDKVVVWFAAANRDPDKYPDPHRVDVGRDAHDHLTFGAAGRTTASGPPGQARAEGLPRGARGAGRPRRARRGARPPALELHERPQAPARPGHARVSPPGAAARLRPQRDVDDDLAARPARASSASPRRSRPRASTG